ncbi:hypothetical protein B0H16DRAFT_1467801 [Mycena metata]|uniref:Uncharacterized protein n=1 Tax=Mycena metata TaxID=1033252 RepID=A0AAD7MWL3_9AGAR|nr:hypothetical protein B0H16DRAFT_1467801 [Mycena metata]
MGGSKLIPILRRFYRENRVRIDVKIGQESVLSDRFDFPYYNGGKDIDLVSQIFTSTGFDELWRKDERTEMSGFFCGRAIPLEIKIDHEGMLRDVSQKDKNHSQNTHIARRKSKIFTARLSFTRRGNYASTSDAGFTFERRGIRMWIWGSRCIPEPDTYGTLVHYDRFTADKDQRESFRDGHCGAPGESGRTGESRSTFVRTPVWPGSQGIKGQGASRRPPWQDGEGLWKLSGTAQGRPTKLQLEASWSAQDTNSRQYGGGEDEPFVDFARCMDGCEKKDLVWTFASNHFSNTVNIVQVFAGIIVKFSMPGAGHRAQISTTQTLTEFKSQILCLIGPSKPSSISTGTIVKMAGCRGVRIATQLPSTLVHTLHEFVGEIVGKADLLRELLAELTSSFYGVPARAPGTMVRNFASRFNSVQSAQGQKLWVKTDPTSEFLTRFFGFRSKLFEVNILRLLSTKLKHLKINFTSNANVTELSIKVRVGCAEGPRSRYFELTSSIPAELKHNLERSSLFFFFLRVPASSFIQKQPEILFHILRLLVRLQPPDPDFDSDKSSTDSDSARGIPRGDILDSTMHGPVAAALDVRGPANEYKFQCCLPSGWFYSRSEIPKWIGLEDSRGSSMGVNIGARSPANCRVIIQYLATIPAVKTVKSPRIFVKTGAPRDLKGLVEISTRKDVTSQIILQDLN